MTRPSITDRERAERLIVLVTRYGRTTGALMSGAAGDADLIGNLPLLALCDLDLAGQRRPTEIQELTGLSSGGVTKLLDRLEKRGLVERSFGSLAEDRRAVVVGITAEGRRIAGLMAAALAERMDITREFSAELVALLDQ